MNHANTNLSLRGILALSNSRCLLHLTKVLPVLITIKFNFFVLVVVLIFYLITGFSNVDQKLGFVPRSASDHLIGEFVD